ncbi:MAG: hypothetical protein ACE5OS_11890 [Anaerolineae bacterium]
MPSTGYDERLVAVWVETRRVGGDGTATEPGDPLHIGFFPDGTFKAVLASHRFETFHDFWGEWRTEGGTLTMTITGGNNLPSQSAYEGRYEVREDELVLEGIALIDDFAGPTTIFSYHGPAPESKIVP